MDLQRLAVVALALAHVAGDIHVGQEVHFHADHAVAFAGFAASAAHVEGEAPRAVAALAGRGHAGKQFADGREEPGVGGGVAAWGATNGALVDGDHLVEVVQTVNLAAGGRFGLGAVELLRQRLVQGVVDEGGLAAARDTGDADHQAHGDVDARFLQVVAAGIQNADPAPVRRLALGGHGNLQGAAQVPAGEGFGFIDDVLHGALGDDLATVLAGAQAHVDHVVGRADGVFVMLDDQYRVAQVTQVGEGGQQPVVVALVKADGGLVQHVHHAGQSGADLRGQPDALGLAAGQGVGRAFQRQVLQAHVVQEAQAAGDLADDPLADGGLGAFQLQVLEPVGGLTQRPGADLPDGFVMPGGAHAYVAGVDAQAGALTGGAGAGVLEFGQFIAHVGRIGLAIAALEVVDDALEGTGLGGGLAAGAERGEGDGLAARTEQQDVADLLGQFLEGQVQVEAVVDGQALQLLVVELVAPIPAAHGAGAQAQVGKLHDPLGIEEQRVTQAVAFRAGAQRVVEREEARLQLGQRPVADGAAVA